MTTLDTFRSLSAKVSNWGRWGDDDELGTLNLITPERLRAAAALVAEGKTFSLGVNFDTQGPQGGTAPFRTNPIHLMTIDGGDGRDLADAVRGWGHASAEMVGGIFDMGSVRFTDDYVMMPLQCATQWDALSHVSYEEQIYNGFPASSVTSFGATRCSIDKVDAKGVAARGVLLDVPRHRGVAALDVGEPVTPSELDAVASAQGVDVLPGDVVLVRTGWWPTFYQTPRNYRAATAGLDWTCAEWLYEREISAVAADNVAVEGGAEPVEGMFLPMHCLCLRDMGMMLGEIWDFEGLAADCAVDGRYEFLLTAPPLRVTGAVGSPLNPIAMK
jgi:kynurenine formamidase